MFEQYTNELHWFAEQWARFYPNSTPTEYDKMIFIHEYVWCREHMNDIRR